MLHQEGASCSCAGPVGQRFSRDTAPRISILLALLLFQSATGQEQLEYRPRVVVRRQFKPIVNPPRVSAAETDLKPEELVLGIRVGEEARAYPINQLTGPRREIINDELGGIALAATW